MCSLVHCGLYEDNKTSPKEALSDVESEDDFECSHKAFCLKPPSQH